MPLQRGRDRLLCRRGAAYRRHALRRGSRPDAQLCAQTAAWRRGRDHAVEFPGRSALVEIRTRAGGGLHVRDQTAERSAAGGDVVCALVCRSGHPAGRAEYCHRAGQHRRRGTRDQPAQPQDRLHRLDRDRPVDRGAGRPAVESRDARTGRQRAVCGLRRRRSQHRRAGGAAPCLFAHRADLHQRQPHFCAARSLQRVRRAVCGDCLPAARDCRRHCGAGRRHGADDQCRRAGYRAAACRGRRAARRDRDLRRGGAGQARSTRRAIFTCQPC